jgi:hypothetical protein
MSFNIREFCIEWGIKERTFYRAIKNLKERGSLKLENNYKVLEVYWGDVTPNSTNPEEYTKFLHSDYWYNVRSIVLSRDKNCCTNCDCTENLQVHHLTYKHYKDELNHLGDLVTLCDECHKQTHHIK